MWIEEHRFLGYRWNVARRWEIADGLYVRRSRYCPAWLLAQLDAGGGYTIEYVEMYLFHNVIAPAVSSSPPP